MPSSHASRFTPYEKDGLPLTQKTVSERLAEIRAAGLYKSERQILGPQGAEIRVVQGEVLNLCANNYLGLANHPDIRQAAAAGLQEHGYGMASVRFICGTQDLHKQLEQAISTFLGTEDTILYSSCFDANGGLFEVLLGEQDAVISDALNHASLIDGIRLCKATRLRYAHSDMADLEAKLRDAATYRLRLIATDGVFSMDGDLAKLDRIVELADRYDAAVSRGRQSRDRCARAQRAWHAGPFRRRRPNRDHHQHAGKDIGRRGRRVYFRTKGNRRAVATAVATLPVFEFTPPVIAAAARRAVILVAQGDQLRARLRENAAFFRAQLTALGFRLIPGEHPIIPIMLGDASLATKMAERLLEEGIYVVGFSYPVVPEGQARIRVQMSAGPHARTA